MSSGGTGAGAPAGTPLVTVLRGRPTPEEVVALVAALSVVHRRTTEPPPPLSRWGDRYDAVRAVISARPGAWRSASWSR